MIQQQKQNNKNNTQEATGENSKRRLVACEAHKPRELSSMTNCSTILSGHNNRPLECHLCHIAKAPEHLIENYLLFASKVLESKNTSD